MSKTEKGSWKARYNNGHFNAAGGSYIYMAFAKAPLVGTNNIPANARQVTVLGITTLSQSPIASLGGTNANVAITGIQLTSSIGASTVQANAIVNVPDLS